MDSEGLEEDRILCEGSESPILQEERAERCCSKCPITVEIITFCVFFAESLSGSVTTNLILMKTCSAHFHYNQSVCNKLGDSEQNATDIEAVVQPYSAVIFTVMNFLSVCPSAVMTLFIGPWSDHNGRKPALLVSALGYFLTYVLLGTFSQIQNVDPIYGLLTVLPVAFTGGIINFITAVYSYISDITEEDNRAFRISILESFMYSASITGFLSASCIFNSRATYAYLLTYGLCAVVVITALIFTYFLVPESVQSTEGGRGIWHMFELKLFKETLTVCFKRRKGYKRAVIFLTMISATLAISVGMGESNVLYLFTRLRFGWIVQDFTLWISVISATDLIGLLVGSFLLSKWLKLSDAIVGFVSYFMKTARSFYIAFVPPNAPSMMYYAGLTCIFGGLCGPASRSVLSKSVPPGDLGKVFAFTGLSEAVIPLAVSFLYTFIYNSTLTKLPSAFLFLSGSLLFMSGVFFVVIYVAQRINVQTEKEKMGDEIESRHLN